jgi:acyl-CoA thioester hydrolase
MTHPDLAAFPVVVELDVAWGDMDSYGHVNNVVYFRYFEHARIAFLDRVGWLASMRETGLGPIVASTSARFRKALTYPDRIRVGARVRDMLADRVTLEHRILSLASNALVCDGEVVVVSYDYRAGVKCPIPETIRKVIAGLEAGK